VRGRSGWGFIPKKNIVVENSGGRLSSDAGLLLVREFDERIGLTAQFAAVLHDTRRDPDHSLLSMVRQRDSVIFLGPHRRLRRPERP